MTILLSKLLFRDQIMAKIPNHKWLETNFNALDELMKERGKEIVALIRLAPVPFTPITYLVGVTQVSAWDFNIGSIAYLFRAVPRIYMGCLMFNASKGSDQSFMQAENEDEDPEQAFVSNCIFWANLVFSMITGFVIGYLAKKKI